MRMFGRSILGISAAFKPINETSSRAVIWAGSFIQYSVIKEAEENAEADKKKKEVIDARNHADGLIHQTEKNIKEHGDKISEDDKKKIELDIEELKKTKDSEDLETIKSKTEQLVQSSLKLGEAIYKQNPQSETPQPDPSGAEPSSDAKDEKVVDADFEEVDEDKKD